MDNKFFSERHGYSTVNDKLGKIVTDKLRTRIWNVFYAYLFRRLGSPHIASDLKEELDEYCEVLWDSILKLNIRTYMKMSYELSVSKFETILKDIPWYTLFDIIEFTLCQLKNISLKNNFKKSLNKVFSEERSDYRLVDNRVVEMTSEEEILEVEKALNLPDPYIQVGEHLKKSLRLLSDREKPDYENSIKESIIALESMALILIGKKENFSVLIKSLDIHPALIGSLDKLYGWASDDGGIRHASIENMDKPKEPEARLTLVLASALVNYIVFKHNK